MTLIDLTRPRTASPGRTALPVAIIGAGPIGLAAAAHLVARGVAFGVYERGDDVAASVAQWGHVRLFSPWRYLVDPVARQLLEREGWEMPPEEEIPTGGELIHRYVRPLAALPAIASHVHTGVEVDFVTREGMDRTRTQGRAAASFVLRTRDADGAIEDVRARAVIDASGTYATPNPLGSNGLPPVGWGEAREHVTHALPDVLGRDRARFAGRRVLVVGAGHSAAQTLTSLAALAEAEPDTEVLWAIRHDSAQRVSASPDDELPARAALGGAVAALVRDGRIDVVDRFEISGVVACAAGVRVSGSRRGVAASVDVDVVVAATGFRPRLDMLREIRLELDDIVEAPKRLAPLIDPNLHSCGTVEPHGFAELRHPEQDFFIVGAKSYGRAPTFLLATGYEQVRSVVAWLDGDDSAARAVQLSLPATGVCSTDGGGCC